MRRADADVSASFALAHERALAAAVPPSRAAALAPVLNEFSAFTRAATFGDVSDLYSHAPTNRIAANYTPTARLALERTRRKPKKGLGARGSGSPGRKATLPPLTNEEILRRPLPPYPDVRSPPRDPRTGAVIDPTAGIPVVPLKEGHVERLGSPDNPFDEERDDEHEPAFLSEGESAGKAGSGARRRRNTRRTLASDPDRRSFTDAQRRAVADAVVRYYHHVERGVSEEEAIAPPKQEWFENVMALVPRSVAGAMSRDDFDREALASLEEMREDYVRAVKRAIVDYALADPSERVRLDLDALDGLFPTAPTADDARRPRGELPRSWTENVDAAREDVAWTLQTLSPNALELEALWADEFAHRVLVDVTSEAFVGMLPATLAAFEEHQSKTLERTRSALWHSWTSQTAECFRRNPPTCVNGDSDAYYAAVAMRQSAQLRELTARSASEYVAFFEARRYSDEHSTCDPLAKKLLWAETPAFLVKLVGSKPAATDEQPVAAFDPPLEAFEKSAIETFHNFVAAVVGIPTAGSDPATSRRGAPLDRVSAFELKELDDAERDEKVTKDSDFVGKTPNDSKYFDGPTRRTVIHGNMPILDAPARIREVMERAALAPRSLAALFDPHVRELLALDVEGHVENVGSKADALEKTSETLATYREEIRRFEEQAETIWGIAMGRVRCGAYEVDATPLRDELVGIAREAARRLSVRVREKAREVNASVGKAFEEMQMRATKDSESAEECVDRKKYMKFLPADLEKLKNDIAANEQRFDFLSEHFCGVPDEEFRLYSVALGWPLRMKEILVKASVSAEKEYRKFEAGIKKRRKDFAELVERLKSDIEAFAEIGGEKGITDRSDITERVLALSRSVAEAQTTSEEINIEERLFSFAPTKYGPTLNALNNALRPYENLWTTTLKVYKDHQDWLENNPFSQLTPEQVDEETADAKRIMSKLLRDFQSGTERRPEPMKVVTLVLKKVEEFQQYVPLIATVCNPGLRERHWEKMTEIVDVVGYELRADDHTTLKKLIEKPLEVNRHLERLAEVSDNASREWSMEKTLDDMLAKWGGVRFGLKEWKETGTCIMEGAPIDDAQALLDEHIIKTQAMRSSPFAKPFVDRTGPWEARLQRLQEIVDEWLKCQSKWLYLEPIFNSDEIMKQIPTEGAAFKSMDASWRNMVDAIRARPDAIAAPDIPNLLEDLLQANRELDVVEKGLNDFLDMKKMAFPRFFFLSNDELLEILSKAKDPLEIQPFMKKCFEAIDKVVFTERVTMTDIVSVEGERIPLVREIDPSVTGAVELWMLEFEEVMKKSIHAVTARSVEEYATKNREDWIRENPGQVAIAGSQVHWTAEVTRAIETGGPKGLEEYGAKSNAQLRNIVEAVRGDLSPLERCTFSALVTIDVHARDVVQQMAQDGVSDAKDFKWLAQLRYFWEEDTLKVRMINAEAYYGFEYLGNSDRLVITPLTDRCYRTLMGAIHLNLGGAPAGPAGTGKTETTKDLSKAIAIQCVVFNCSDGLDYKAMGKFFKGLAASGAWACFDEFNRIELEVLSVIAQQVLCIQRAVAANLSQFVFEGVELRLIRTANVFITMNPGYAGRSELPDNLKALFRDVAMMVPDYAMIAEIKLYSYGYLEARDMARKLVQTYRLCSEQLSSQDHYDYGMRAVISVLRAAGNLKRKYTDSAEDVLMLRAITDVNLPKFLDQDVPLFRGILSDLFPGVKLNEIDYVNILDAMRAGAKKENLQPLETFFEKIIQLYEMIVVRHGLMIVGESFGMKSSCISVLAEALGTLHEKGLNGEQKVKYYCINPKSVTMNQLYGAEDPVSKEWADGVLAVTFRGAARDESPDRKWVVFDGPVDAIWIENMNTVLDDNKKLCLNSGEIIQMSGLMNMIFEVQDLAVASPATVSRCGMVYVQASLLGWRPLLLSWLDTLPPAVTDAHKEQLRGMFDWLLPPTLRLATKRCKMPQPMHEINLARSLMRLFEALLDPEFMDDDVVGAMKPAVAQTWLDSMFLFALVWSVGASVDEEGRARFDKTLRGLLVGDVPKDLEAWTTGAPRKVSQLFPSDPGSTVYDYVFDKTTSKWTPWTKTGNFDEEIPEDANYTDIIVPTLDTIRYTFLIDVFARHGVNFLLVGATGTGKTAYVKRHLAGGLDPETYQYQFMNFSAQTSANATQDIVDGAMPNKRRKGVYGPPHGKKMVVFVDDLNMPQVEEYGAQPPIELLRQFMDYRGWYDRKELAFRTIEDTQFCAAMGPPGGGRNHVTNRYLRHFSLVCVAPFDETTLSKIFSTLVDWWVRTREIPAAPAKLASALVAGTVDLYDAVQRELLPTPTKSHYTFNLRDVSKVFQGICATESSAVEEAPTLVRLWVHESLRVFADRLTDDPDRATFFETVKTLTEKHFGTKFNKVFSHLDKDEDGDVDLTELRRLMFGNFLVPGADPMTYQEVTEYDALKNVVAEYLDDFNASSKKPMHLVLFLFALEHVCRIARVLSQPGGHALLVGVGGSGRQSLTRLAAFTQNQTVFQIELSKTYGRPEWRDDLKKMMKLAGEENKQTVFLFSDTQIANEGFVEDISNILNTGEVPNLMEAGDMVTIFETIAGRAKAAGIDAGNKSLMRNFFVAEVRRNLHVVLAFSPVGEAFRERLRKFPSLVTCTTIDWFSAWPQDALHNVAKEFLSEVKVEEATKAPLAEICVAMHSGVGDLSARFLSEARRHFYVTPTSYLELIQSYKDLLAKKQKEVSDVRSRYDVGLEKLVATEKSVAVMQEEIVAKQPKLIKAGEETAAAMVVINAETVEADKIKEVVAKDEAAATEEAARVQAIADECDADVKAAEPLVEAAKKAVSKISGDDIAKVKKGNNPHKLTRLVLEAICVIKNLKPVRGKNPDDGKMFDDYWPTSQKMLGEMTFKRSLTEFDINSIKPKIIKKLQKYINNPDFDPKKLKKISGAMVGLCKWVHAVVKYDAAMKVITPKREAQAVAEAELAEVNAQLAEKRAELQKVIDKVQALNDDLVAKQTYSEELEADMELCKVRLVRAEKLIGGLGGEKIRWTAASERLAVEYERLTGDALLSSGVIAYLGAFSATYRELIIAEWIELCRSKGIACDGSYSLVKTLGDPVRIREWNIQGLPKDAFSAENGTMVQYGRRWPLFIDPQGQANKWVREMEKARGLVVIKLTDDTYMRSLEMAVRFGKPVLLENVLETVDASLEPLLLKQTFKSGGATMIKLGDDAVEYNDEFKFYITTKLRNPHYTPEMCTKVSLLNFMITLDGLEDQLLGVVVAKERPDLAEEKNALIVQGAANKKQLKEIEDQILKVLSSSEGNILDDEGAVKILSASKVLSDEISEKQKIADATEAKIDETRAGYRSVAKHSSLLFFCVADMANIGDMYQYSLQWFTDLFLRGIEDAPTDPRVPIRLKHIVDHFTFFLYVNVCRSLFEKDKLLFSFLITTKVLLAATEENKARDAAEAAAAAAAAAEEEAALEAAGSGDGEVGEEGSEASEKGAASEKPPSSDDDESDEEDGSEPEDGDEMVFSDEESPDGASEEPEEVRREGIEGDELRFFLTGGISTGDNAEPNPAPAWLSDKAWGEILRMRDTLPTVAARGDLPAAVALDPEAWKVLYDSPTPQSERLPPPFDAPGALTPLQRMLVTRAFRPDKVVPAITDFVGAEMGQRYVDPLPFDLGACFADSSAGTPLVFVLSAGSDPMANLLKFAESKKRKVEGKERSTRVEAVSLGQGQGPFAMRCIEEGAREGHWVVLQNCHLAKSFMPELEQVCESGIKRPDVHEDFRLWLTSYPSPIFPVSILETSVKMTNEAPKGLRAGLTRTFTSDPLSDMQFYETCGKDAAWRKMVFGLAFFHSSMQERRKYGPVGFNIPYEFNENDLRISIRQLKMFLDEYDEVPWETLLYTAGECNYGGKVTDGHDRVTVMSALRLFYDPKILDDEYAFSPSGIYRAPPHGEYQSYLDYVNTLPLIASPEVYGFHANADISKDVKDAEELLDAFASTQSRDGGGGGKSPEEVIGEVAADLLARCPPDFDVELAERTYPVDYLESMNTVLTQELGRVNALLRVIRGSLANLGKAVKGLVLMSDELDAVGKALYDGKVPALWLKKSFPSLKPLGSYFKEVTERAAFFERWVAEGAPATFPLYAFFFTQAFLTGSKQNFARKHKIEIDKVDFDYAVLEGQESDYEGKKPDDGVYCFGMHLDSCAWSAEAKSLCEAEPKALYVACPGIHMIPAPVTAFKKYNHYSCPLYKTADRRGILSTTGHSTNFVMDIRLPCEQSGDHWIRRGACALLTLKD